MNVSRNGLLIATMPGMLLLVLFYSLAIHMLWRLDGWPASIGERCFPPALVAHAAIAVNFTGLLVVSLLAMPVPILICLFVKRWQRFAAYFSVYAAVTLLCCAMTFFAAPTPFLTWWKD